jgi:hypothetical protein
VAAGLAKVHSRAAPAQSIVGSLRRLCHQVVHFADFALDLRSGELIRDLDA